MHLMILQKITPQFDQILFTFIVETNLSIANHVFRVFTCFLGLVAGKIVPQCFIYAFFLSFNAIGATFCDLSS